MIFKLIAVILGASLAFVDHLGDLTQLLVPLINVPRVQPSAQVTIHEDKRAVLEAEPHCDCALVASLVRHGWFDGCHRHIENARLNLGFGDQKDVESMLICLADQCILSTARMHIQHSHYVILHEGKSVNVFGPS